MALLSIREVSVSYGGPVLLNRVSFQIEQGERVCLLGRNGEGKSTLMRLISGERKPDSGEIALQKGARIAYLPQEVPLDIQGRVFDVVAGGLPEHESPEDHQVSTVLNRLKIDGDADFATLSGGLKRRALLAKALVCEPDLLVLDEPTNHLDIDSITWMEEFLLRSNGTLLFVTHDRVFLQKLATRIVEIDRGRLTSWACNYPQYLERKAALLEAEEKNAALFDKKLAEEEAWIRRGVKARTTRNEGRVRALKQMREDRRARREVTGMVRLQAQDADRSGRLVVEATNVHFGYDGTPVINGLSTTIMRGDKVGIIGANGTGKTTLLRLLLGDLQPQQGTIKLGTRLQVAYFDQLRGQLDENKTVQQNVAGENDTVTINGERRHIIGYLQEFLFSPERARTPVSVLSGGERNRLLLARLFTQPSNVLVMDEPTNDLDAETLELLEDVLVEYAGTLLLVSHDRAFLNNVVTSTLAPEGDGRWREYVGGYDDWLRQSQVMPAPVRNEKPAAPKAAPKPAAPARPRKLSFKEQRELESLPARIETLEAEHSQLVEAMAAPEFYKGNGSEVTRATQQLETLEQTLAQAYARWEELEALNAQVAG